MSRLLLALVSVAVLCGCTVAQSVDLIFHRHGPAVVEQAHAVVECESGGDPGAVSSGGGNHGAAQINNVHRASFERVTGQPWNPGIYDAWWNIYFANWLYEQSGNSWRAWSCSPN